MLRLPGYAPWLFGFGLVVVFLVRGMYAAALGCFIGCGIVLAGLKGVILRQQDPSKLGNLIAVVLVFAAVCVLLFAWWVGRGA